MSSSALTLNRGTVRCENYHQKLDSAIGPWGIGARTAHNLLLLRTYCYNVSTGISRCGEPNFGHPYLHLVDRTQSRISELYDGTVVLPRHKNLLDFKTMDLISVGIGPISLDPEFVTVGPSKDGMSADLSFLARQMGVTIPPIMPCTKEEFTPTSKTWSKMARVFVSKADGRTIFPKLPSMLRSYDDRWKANQSVKQIQLAVAKGEVGKLKEALRNKRADPSGGREREEAKRYSQKAEKFVPPLSAPKQESEVKPKTQQRDRQCAWEPVCDCLANMCGGWTRIKCQFYGENGSRRESAPSEEELWKLKQRPQRKRKRNRYD
jgi:hypothetical protein